MDFKLTKLFLKTCFVLIALNTKLAEGRKRRYHEDDLPSSKEIEEIVSDAFDELRKPQIDMRGTLRAGMAVQMALADPNRNAVCSPVSALLPLGKLVLGATGGTKKELLKAIGYHARQFKSSIRQLIKSLRTIGGGTLDVVSKLYVSESSQLQPDFAKDAKDLFDSTVEKVNFGNRREAADSINAFVKKETRNMIPKLLSPEDISPQSSVILVNAIYFQGDWKKHFDKAVPSTFYGPSGARTVPMMEVIGYFKYMRDDALGVQILELPYVNQNASFIVVLPDDRDGLPMLLSALKLAPNLLNKAMKKMKDKTVKVYLPKFKVTTKLDLKDIFRKVGVSRIFQDYRELDKIVQKKSVYVSSAIQQAVIEVSETGTEAAAATGMQIVPVSLLIHDVLFKATHPFLFFVSANEQQLFAGVYSSQ